jgi:hypothetical protein
MQAGVSLQAPVALTQGLAYVLQLRCLKAAGPVGFQCLLQFAFRANARESQIMNDGHVVSSFLIYFNHCSGEPKALRHELLVYRIIVVRLHNE